MQTTSRRKPYRRCYILAHAWQRKTIRLMKVSGKSDEIKLFPCFFLFFPFPCLLSRDTRVTIQLYSMIHFDESTVFLLFHVICNAHLYKYTTFWKTRKERETERGEGNLLRNDCKIRGRKNNFISFAKDKYKNKLAHTSL